MTSLGKPKWLPTPAGKISACIYKKLAARISKGHNVERRFMKHCMKWLNHAGSLEAMASDLMNLNPGQASEEVNPDVLKARMFPQVHDTLQQEVLQQVTTGTQFALNEGWQRKGETKRRGSPIS